MKPDGSLPTCFSFFVAVHNYSTCGEIS